MPANTSAAVELAPNGVAAILTENVAPRATGMRTARGSPPRWQGTAASEQSATRGPVHHALQGEDDAPTLLDAGDGG